MGMECIPPIHFEIATLGGVPDDEYVEAPVHDLNVDRVDAR
jgi:hypothetical protein